MKPNTASGVEIRRTNIPNINGAYETGTRLIFMVQRPTSTNATP